MMGTGWPHFVHKMCIAKHHAREVRTALCGLAIGARVTSCPLLVASVRSVMRRMHGPEAHWRAHHSWHLGRD